MSSSWFEDVRRYVATRLPARLFLPCAGFLVSAGLSGGRPLDPGGLALAGGLALSLLLQFRLWDDLCDLPHDRRTHPARVLARAPSLAPFRTLLAASFLLNLVLVALQPGPARLAAFGLLNAAALLWYRWVRNFVPGRVLGYHVVLGKYPAFVLLLSGEVRDGWRLALATALVYLSFSIHEALHDRTLQPLPAVTKALLVETVAFFAVSEIMALDLLGRGPSAVILQGLLGLSALLSLGKPLSRRLRAEPAKATYLVFAFGLALVLNLSLGGRL